MIVRDTRAPASKPLSGNGAARSVGNRVIWEIAWDQAVGNGLVHEASMYILRGLSPIPLAPFSFPLFSH